ncbi:hypothetical protein [Sphingobacterium puteale]|uniref:hypothetical protein n=1 Tax=Sphingobacterium puteale TaxID=2420510 RepID=UPI003D959062
MKKTALTILLITSLFSCKPKIHNSKNKVLDSFKNETVSKKLNDKESYTQNIQLDTNYLALIGERDFLDIRKGDFYLLYFFKEARDTIFNIYSVKSKDGFNTASRRVESLKDEILINGEIVAYQCKFNSYKIDDKTLLSLKKTLDLAVTKIKKMLPYDYDSPMRIILYFDGNKFVRMSALEIEEPDLNVLDSAIRNFKPFIAGGK